MGRNTTAMKRGWNYDKPNSLLKAMVDGAEAFALSTTKGFSTAGQTLTPGDATRSYMSIGIGSRDTKKDITMKSAVGAQHLDPFQLNLNVIGANPSDTSTINAIYQKITHDTIGMSNLRLKCADWNVVVKKNVLDAYVYQGEIDITGPLTIGGEACVLGLVMNISGGAVTGGGVRGAIISMTGVDMPAANSMGLFINTGGGATLHDGIYIETQDSTTMVNAIRIGNAGTITNPLAFNAVITDAVSVTTEAPLNNIKEEVNQGYIRVLVGTDVRYIALYAAKVNP